MAERRRAAYRVETDRTVIRCWSPGDARMLRAVLDESQNYLRPWIPWMKDEPKTLDQTADWLRSNRANFDLDNDYRYGVFDPKEETLIGETGLYTRAGKGAREIGYWINREYGGQGYATETTAAMVKVAFEIDQVDRVEIQCAVANAISATIPDKLGFVHETNLKRRIEDTEGTIHDIMIWTLFADQYPGSPASDVRLSAFDCVGDKIL